MRKLYITLLAALIAAFFAFYIEISSKRTVLEKLAEVDSTVHFISEKNNGIFNSVYELLSRAKHSIVIANYAYDNQAILHLLNRKAQEGVDVTVIYDRGRSSDWIADLNPAIKKITRADGEGYVHHKIIVVDGEFIWFGSANFNSFNAKNIAMEFQSPEMAQKITHEMKLIAGKKPRLNPRPFIETVGGQKMELFFLPHDDAQHFQPIAETMNDIARKKLLNLINQAKISIRASVVVFTYKDVAKALVNAANRGVKVELIGSNIDRQVEQILQEGKVPIRKVKGPYHHKWMLVDNDIFWNGSANWSMSAFSRTDDSVIVLQNLTPEQRQFLEKVWQDLLKSSS